MVAEDACRPVGLPGSVQVADKGIAAAEATAMESREIAAATAATG
jgi:hypothetical protein